MGSTIVQDLMREQLAELEEIKTEYLKIGKTRQAAVVSERMEEIYNQYLAADTVEKSGPEPKANVLAAPELIRAPKKGKRGKFSSAGGSDFPISNASQRRPAYGSSGSEEPLNVRLIGQLVQLGSGEGNTGVIVRVSPRNKAFVVRLSDGRLAKVRAQDLRFVGGEARRSKQTGRQPKTRGQ